MRLVAVLAILVVTAVACGPAPAAAPTTSPAQTIAPASSVPRTASPDPTGRTVEATSMPSPTRPAAPTGTPRPGATPRPEFGVIVNHSTMGGDPPPQPQLRGEVDRSVLAEFPSGFYRQWRGAVSADGRTLAYWHDTERQTGWELRILETSALDRPRTVLQLRDELPEGLLWSGDQGGLVFGVSDKLTGQGVIGQYTALRTLDLATGNVTELARDRKWFHALAWDRRAGFLAATETSPDGTAMTGYLLWERGVLRRIALDGTRDLIGSPDGTRIVGVWGGWANDQPPNFVRVWPISDHTRVHRAPGRSSVPGARGAVPASERRAARLEVRVRSRGVPL